MAIKEVGVKLVVDGLADFKSKIGQANSEISGMGQKLKQAAPALRNAGLAIAGVATGVGVASLKMAADFEGAMREVNTMMNLSEEEFQSLSDQVLETAKDVGKAPEEMAEALYQIISAGVPAGEAMEFLATSARAAIGGVTDTTTAVDGITTVINAFGLSAKDAESVASTMFETVKSGKTTFDELSSYMFQVANSAAAMDVPFATVSAALATMTKQGIPTAQATTQLRQAMVALQKPTEDMKVALENLGYASGKELIQAKGLDGALQLLRDVTQGNDEQLGKMFGSVEALNAVLSLTGKNAEGFKKDLVQINKASKDATASTKAYNEMNKSTARQFEQLMTNIKITAIEIGDALMPALLSLIEAIKPILEKVAGFISKHPKLTAAIVAITAAVGGLLLALGLLMPVLTSLGAIVGVIASPITAVAVAIAAVVAVTTLLITKWDELATWIKVVGIAFLALMSPVAATVVLIKNYWDELWGAVKAVWDTVGSPIFDAIRWVYDNIFKPVFKGMKWYVEFVLDKWIYAFNLIKTVFTTAWDGVKWVYEHTIKPVMDGILKGIKAIKDAWEWAQKINPLAGGESPITIAQRVIDKVDAQRIAEGINAGFSASITGFQHGGISGGGTAMVGEAGPELVSLPTGAVVQPLTNNYEYNITENYARPDHPQSLDLSLQALAMYARQ